MNQNRAEQLGEFQVVLGLHSSAAILLAILGGFLYTSIVEIVLSIHADKLKGAVTLLLYAFTALIDAFFLWQMGSLDVTRLRGRSRWIWVGNWVLLIAVVLLLLALFFLVTKITGNACANLIWLILSVLSLVLCVCGIFKVLNTCRDVGADIGS